MVVSGGCGGGVKVVSEAGGTADGDEFGDGDVVAILLHQNQVMGTIQLTHHNLHSIMKSSNFSQNSELSYKCQGFEKNPSHKFQVFVKPTSPKT